MSNVKKLHRMACGEREGLWVQKRNESELLGESPRWNEIHELDSLEEENQTPSWCWQQT